jgi:putative transposase
METINGLFKTECIRTAVFHDGPDKTLADVEYATVGWVDW